METMSQQPATFDACCESWRASYVKKICFFKKSFSLFQDGIHPSCFQRKVKWILIGTNRNHSACKYNDGRETCWATPGPALEQYCPNIVERHWPNTGPGLVKYLSSKVLAQDDLSSVSNLCKSKTQNTGECYLSSAWFWITIVVINEFSFRIRYRHSCESTEMKCEAYRVNTEPLTCWLASFLRR